MTNMINSSATEHTSTARQHSLALLLLRLATGAVFVMHGYQKFFEYKMAGTIGAFTHMGAPMPTLSAPLVATIELLGGLLLILGLFSRVAAVLLALDMLGAILLVHLKAGFFSPAGFEFPMTLLAACAALALVGPGRYSLSRH